MVKLVCFEYFRFQNNPLKLHLIRASLVAQMVKNLPATQETWVQSLGWEDALEKGTATHSCTGYLFCVVSWSKILLYIKRIFFI